MFPCNAKRWSFILVQDLCLLELEVWADERCCSFSGLFVGDGPDRASPRQACHCGSRDSLRHPHCGLVRPECSSVLLPSVSAATRQSCRRRRCSRSRPVLLTGSRIALWDPSHPPSPLCRLHVHLDLGALSPARHASWRLSHRTCRPHTGRRLPPYAPAHSGFIRSPIGVAFDVEWAHSTFSRV